MPMAEQILDHADVDTLLQQVSGKTMPQRMHGDGLAEAGNVSHLPADPLQLPRRDVALRRFGSAPGKSQCGGRSTFQ